MSDRQPPSWPPPPPPPPPEPGREPSRGGEPSRASAAGRSVARTPLDVVSSPYGILLALVSVLIFMSPNLLVLATDGLPDAAAALPEGPELVVGLVITLVLQVVVTVFALLPLLTAGRPYSRLLGPTRGTGLMWLIGLGVGVVTVIVTYTVNAISVLSLGDGEAVDQQVLDIALQGGAATVLAVVLAVVLAPIGEELIFRGVLFRALADRTGMWPGALLSSAIFALIHIEVVISQPLALTGLFTVGLVLAVAYHRTGSIIVPIVGHATFNAFSVTLAILADRLGFVAG